MAYGGVMEAFDLGSFEGGAEGFAVWEDEGLALVLSVGPSSPVPNGVAVRDRVRCVVGVAIGAPDPHAWRPTPDGLFQLVRVSSSC